MMCSECGVEMQVGFYPFCHGDPTKHATQASSVNGDECDFVQENGFAVATRFTSKREWARALAEKGLECKVRHMPVPGSDKSPHTTDWSKGSIDQQTLANAAALVARAGQTTRTAAPNADVPVTWTIREVGE